MIPSLFGFRKLSALCVCLLTLLRTSAFAWTDDPTLNTQICNSAGNTRLTGDGAGGAIITWGDGRSPTGSDVYAQRVGPNGLPQWTANGVAICASIYSQGDQQIISDGAGGAFIVWVDQRHANGDTDHPNLFAQRINSAGVIQWAANGVAISTASGPQFAPQLILDGAGGIIIAWQDGRSGFTDIYAQRLNALGAAQWAGNGIAVNTSAHMQVAPVLVTDGAGGAIIVWQDLRSTSQYDLYAQRIDSAGSIQWTATGNAVCTHTAHQYEPQVISDGAVGVIITWYDYRNGAPDIYAQRVDGDGASQWTSDGTPVCTATSSQLVPRIESDGSGGAIVCWYDYRAGATADIYAQRLDSAGAVQWPLDGTALCTATGNQVYPEICSDGSGGIIAAWNDARNGAFDNFAQRITSTGSVSWTANGIPVSTATNKQEWVRMTSDGAGGAVMAWEDYRRGAVPARDVYAQGVKNNGTLPVSLSQFEAE